MRRSALVACAAACLLAPSASAASCPPPPDPQPAIADLDAPPPDALIACVALRPIDGRRFSHWLEISRRGSPGNPPPSALREQVAQFLITSFWVEAEAAERRFGLADTTVRRTMRKQRQASYPRLADFHRFLRETGMTRSDVKYRVRLDLLSEKLRRGGVDPGRFHDKWKSRTWCRADYRVDLCGS